VPTGKPLQPDPPVTRWADTAPAIESWQQWTGELRAKPVVVGPLSGGLSNRSFLLDSAGKKMVLRLNNSSALLPGLNRNDESSIWQAASAGGIAPRLLYVDQAAGHLVSAYIDNSLTPQHPSQSVFTDQALELLARCHQLEVDAGEIDYTSHIEQYWRIIESKYPLPDPALTQQREPMQAVLETLLRSGSPMGLCHHDPVVANFVGKPQRLYLVDWEYAARGLLVMDYAALGIEWNIDDPVILAATGIDQEQLFMAKALYGYLCELWQQASA